MFPWNFAVSLPSLDTVVTAETNFQILHNGADPCSDDIYQSIRKALEYMIKESI